MQTHVGGDGSGCGGGDGGSGGDSGSGGGDGCGMYGNNLIRVAAHHYYV